MAGFYAGAASEGAAGSEDAAQDSFDGAVERELTAAHGAEGVQDANPGGAANVRGITEFNGAGLEIVAVADIVGAVGVDNDVEVEVDEVDGAARDGRRQGGVALGAEEAAERVESVEDGKGVPKPDGVDGEGGRLGRWRLAVVKRGIVESDEPVFAAAIDEVAGPYGPDGATVLAFAKHNGVGHCARGWRRREAASAGSRRAAMASFSSAISG